jgi:hypothetical protein
VTGTRRTPAGQADPQTAPIVDQVKIHLDPADVVDVFVYVVVLNLAIEFVPAVISETFTMSLLTAVLLKVVLEVVVFFKNRAKNRLKTAETPVRKVVAGVILWLVLVGSKFVVLELVALVFGEYVSLGGFFAVTGLILVLLLSRAGVRELLQEPDPALS